MHLNEMQEITKRYAELCELVPLKPILQPEDYEAAVENLNRLMDAGGANEAHPLAGVVDLLGSLIHSYEMRQESNRP